MDYASGTPIDKNVLKKMKPFFNEQFFNPGSIYQEGFDIRDILGTSRAEIARAISARPQEIIFTDGGTEANNLVLRGLVSKWRTKNQKKKPHIIISNIEHASILETCKDLEKKKLIDLSYINVDEYGKINLNELKKTIHENTLLISIAYANGEIGVVQDIRAIAKTIRHYKKNNPNPGIKKYGTNDRELSLPYFHTDAVQALNYLDLNVLKLGVDFMTINASKIYGPKKIAALYKKTGIDIDSIITGGSQEFGLRAGTENIPFIVGFAESIKKTIILRDSEYKRLFALQNYFEKKLFKEMKLDYMINGQGTERIPNIINISIPEISSEEIVLRLDAAGIKVSVKSACKSSEFGDSHVITSLRKYNTQSIRFSMGRDTQKSDIDYIVHQLATITNTMKNIFNLYIKK